MGGRSAAFEEGVHCVFGGFAVEADERADEEPEPVAGFLGFGHILRRAHAAFEEDEFEFAEIGFGKRDVGAQLVDSEVTSSHSQWS